MAPEMRTDTELTLVEIEWRKKKLQEEDEFDDLTEEAKTLQEQELEKVGEETRLRGVTKFRNSPDVCLCRLQIKSNLGRLILKEEKEKDDHFRRKTQSLPDRTHMHTSKTTLTLRLRLEGESALSKRLVLSLQVHQQGHRSLPHTQAQA